MFLDYSSTKKSRIKLKFSRPTYQAKNQESSSSTQKRLKAHLLPANIRGYLTHRKRSKHPNPSAINMTTTRSQSQAQAQAMSTPQAAEATQESDSLKSTSSQASIGSTPSQGSANSTKSQESPYPQDGVI